MEQDLVVGKLAPLTGRGSGRRRAAAMLFAPAGAKVSIAGSRAADPAQVTGDGRASHRALLTAPCGVSSQESVLIHRVAIAMCIILTLAFGICCLCASTVINLPR